MGHPARSGERHATHARQARAATCTYHAALTRPHRDLYLLYSLYSPLDYTLQARAAPRPDRARQERHDQARCARPYRHPRRLLAGRTIASRAIVSRAIVSRALASRAIASRVLVSSALPLRSPAPRRRSGAARGAARVGGRSRPMPSATCCTSPAMVTCAGRCLGASTRATCRAQARSSCILLWPYLP